MRRGAVLRGQDTSGRRDGARGRRRPVRSLASTIASALVALCGAVDASAQPFGVHGGAALPSGRTAEGRRAGPLAGASVTFGGTERRLRGRVAVEGAWLRGEGGRAEPQAARRDMRVVGALASLLVGARGTGVRPYALVGAGVQWQHVPGARNPYGAVPGVTGGAGVEWSLPATGGAGRARPFRVVAELRAHGVLSDFASGADFRITTYWPLVVGVRF